MISACRVHVTGSRSRRCPLAFDFWFGQPAGTLKKRLGVNAPHVLYTNIWSCSHAVIGLFRLVGLSDSGCGLYERRVICSHIPDKDIELPA